MSVYLSTALFYCLLLFLLMCGTLCGHVRADSATEGVSAPVKTIELFTKDKKITDGSVKGPSGDKDAKEVEVKDFYSPVLLSAGDYIFALAGVNSIGTQEKKINILTNYTEKDKLLAAEDLSKPELTWTTQFAVHNEEIEGADKVVKGLLAVAKGDKIYLLRVNYSTKTGASLNIGDSALKFAVGATEVIKSSEKKIFKWEELPLTVGSVAGNLKKKLDDAKDGDYSFSGSAFLVKENIVFALIAKNNKKKIAALMQLKNGQDKSNIEKTRIFENCYFHLFPWKEKIIMISADCDSNKNGEIIELSDDLQEAQSDSKGAFSGHYEFLKNKRNFVTIQNGTTELLLFTEHKEETDEGAKKKKVCLWMSDGTRVSCAGTIAEDVDGGDSTFYVSLLYTGNKLFALHQTSKTPDKIEFTLLKDQLQNITKTLDAWRESNDKIENLYKNGATPITDINFTDGIVGFLSGDGQSTNGKEWKDQYLYVNAEITLPGTNAVKVQDGFKFSGAGAGAQWPVGKREDQRYNFINPGFTLVATVTVGSETKGADNSVLGVGFKGDTNKVGLWCSTGGKWEVKNGQTKAQLPEINCTRDERYYVALVLDISKKVFIYVDGQQLPKDGEIDIGQSTNVDYFYFGADSGPQTPTETDVTITNVLLYNRPFEREKIQQLKSEKKEVNTQALSEGDGNKTPAHEDTTEETNGAETNNSPATSATPTTTEKDGAEIKLRLFSINGVTVFSSLFGVFTLLGRYVH